MNTLPVEAKSLCIFALSSFSSMLAFRVCSSERNADACAWCNFNSCSEFPRPPFLVSKQIEEMKHVPYNVYSCCSFTGLALAVDLKVLCLVVPLCFFPSLVCHF